MWGKNENDNQPEVTRTVPRSEPVASKVSNERSVIGTSLHVKGEVGGSEDLLIEGVVEGMITLKQNMVTVGKGGRVQADIHAKTVIIEGEVTGNLFGSEQVIVHRSGLVKGNIKAPRVSLEDGARIKGAIDTDPGHAEAKADADKNGTQRNAKRAEETDAQAAARNVPMQ